MFWQQFIAITDAGSIIMELLHEDIISRGDVRTITRTADPTEQNLILHFCLKEKCTKEVFRTLLTEVQGNPKMRTLGEDMDQRLETGVCIHVCMRACACVCVCVDVWGGVVCMLCGCMCVIELFLLALYIKSLPPVPLLLASSHIWTCTTLPQVSVHRTVAQVEQ